MFGVPVRVLADEASDVGSYGVRALRRVPRSAPQSARADVWFRAAYEPHPHGFQDDAVCEMRRERVRPLEARIRMPRSAEPEDRDSDSVRQQEERRTERNAGAGSEEVTDQAD